MRERVRRVAADRCGYCLSRQEYVLGRLHLEHIIPAAKGGSDDENNLWLACSLCNNYKGVQTEEVDPITGATVSLFNPSRDSWTDHFHWAEEGTLLSFLTSSIDTTFGIRYSATMAVLIDIPEDVLDSARLSVAELKTELAVWLYASGRLSLGKARELAGLSLWQFRQLLASRGVSPHYGTDDLLEDVQTLRDMGRL